MNTESHVVASIVDQEGCSVSQLLEDLSQQEGCITTNAGFGIEGLVGIVCLVACPTQLFKTEQLIAIIGEILDQVDQSNDQLIPVLADGLADLIDQPQHSLLIIL